MRWLLIAAVMGLVLWVRLLPLELRSADSIADQMVHRSLGAVAAPSERPRSRAQIFLEQQEARWKREHAAQLEANRRELAQRLRAQRRFEGEDGREYAYLGDWDSYAWLRLARNYLSKGTICDAVDDRGCRDTYTTAPLGSPLIYDRSLHVAAIVGMHWVASHVDPGFPLPMSSYLVPVLVGVLGVIPAFFLGRLAGGDLGGVFAAVIISLNQVVLGRTIGSDNDVWNIVLPLWAAWALVAALDTRDRRNSVAWTVSACVVTVLYEANWSGWVFTFVVLLAGVLGGLFLEAGRAWLRGARQGGAHWRDFRRLAVVGAVFVAATVMLIGVAHPPAVGALLQRLTGLFSRPVRLESLQRAQALSPNVFATVSELTQPNLTMITGLLGGRWLFAIGLAGMVALFFPPRGWRGAHLLVLAAAAVYYWVVAAAPVAGGKEAVALLAAPVVVALPFSLREADGAALGRRVLGLVVLVWFHAALYQSYAGVRFLILLVPPFGFACAAVAGGLYETLLRAAQSLHRIRRPLLLRSVLALVIAALLILPIHQGYAAAASYVPMVNDAWWDALSKIRLESKPDAIVDTWWDYGYWVKYIAERRVSADGSSLQTRLPYWLARAFSAPDSRQAAGLLRMLNCGSDLPPDRGSPGAFGELVKLGVDPAMAFSTVLDLASLDRGAAESHLEQLGLSAEARGQVLRLTHCDPPQSFLVLSAEMARKASTWMSLASWDFARSYGRDGQRPSPSAATAGGIREARDLAERAIRTLTWLPCRRTPGDTGLFCPIDVSDPASGEVLVSFSYDGGDPARSRLHFRAAGGRAASGRDLAPGALLIAAAEGLNEIRMRSTRPELGVLVDPKEGRILVDFPVFLRSTFADLFYLDGRYAPQFRRFDDRSVEAGDRIATWQIDWKGGERREASAAAGGDG